MSTPDNLARIRQFLLADDTGLAFKSDARWLLAELDRVTGERDRLFDVAVYDDQNETDSVGELIYRSRGDSISRAMLWMQAELRPPDDVAAALADHDRKAREGN